VITLELLEGRREEMYWENLPEKVRVLAVQRAQQHETQREDVMSHGDDEETSIGMSGRKKRRRRR
jgi:xRRM domain